MKSKRAEGAGKTLIQSQSSIWHKNTCQVGLCDWIHVSPGQPPHGALFKLYSSRGRLWASRFFHTILLEFPLTRGPD